MAESTRPAPAAGLDRSYHHLYVTTAQIPRTRLFDLPFGLWVTCDRVGGWSLWDVSQVQRFDTLPPAGGVLVGGEYAGPDKWLVLDVAGYVILDSRQAAPEPEASHG